MRLEPIEKPKGLMMRIAYWMTRRQFGKVMTLMKLEIARRRESLRLTYEISKFELKGIRLERRVGDTLVASGFLHESRASLQRQPINICDRLFSSCDSMGSRSFYILDSG
jgi:hypothetical protein